MPHIVIEYSRNIDTAVRESGLMLSSYRTVLDAGLFDPEAVKARSIIYDDYVLPEGAEHFVHISVSIMAGRDDSARTALADALFAQAKQAVPHVSKLSVNIHEMDAQTYRK